MSWPLVELKYIGEFCAGFGFPDKYQGKETGDFPFAKVGDISTVARGGNKYISSARNYVDRNELSSLKAKLLPAGSIVFAKIGEAIRQNFRAVTSAEMLIDNNAMGLVPDLEKIDVDYLYHFMCTLDLYKYSGATTVPSIRKSVLEEIEIPLPPLAEQKRIAAILDKADAIRRKRQQAIKLADEFLRSVFLDMFGDPVTNPKGWEVKELQNGILSIKSGWSAKGADHPCGSGQLGVLKISAVTSGVFKKSENKCVPFAEIPDGKNLLFPKKGDLLFSRANTRELVAATCIISEDENDVFLPDKLWLIEADKKQLLPEFLHHLIWHPKFKDTLTSQATGTSGSMLNISKAKFEITKSIFPDINQQEEFKTVFWKVQKMLNSIKDSDVAASNSFNALSQKAFSGSL